MWLRLKNLTWINGIEFQSFKTIIIIVKQQYSKMKNDTQSTWLKTSMLTLNQCNTFLEISLWIATISLVINVLNVLVILPSKLRTRLSYRLIINLSVSDAILDLTMIIYVSSVKAGVIWSLTGFYSITCIFQIGGLVSLWTLIVLSFELFVRMMYPLKYFQLTKMTSFRGTIFYIWIVSIIPYFTFDMTVAAFTMSNNETVFHRAISDDFRPNCINSICAVIGLVVLLALYAQIFRDIFSFTERLQGIRISLKKSAVTICLVILVYFICFLPLWMYNFVQLIVGTDLSIDDTAFTIECLSYVLYALNTFFDPVIYAFRLPIIRNIYFKLWQKIVKR